MTPRYTGKGDSQEDKILALLMDARGGWVPAPALAKVCLQYCRAISALRRDGKIIFNRVEQHGKVRHGFYRLECGRATIRTMPPVNVPPANTASTAPMFAQPLVRRMD